MERKYQARIIKVNDVRFCGPNDYEVSVQLELISNSKDGFNETAKYICLSEVRNWFGVTKDEFSVEYRIEPGAVIEFTLSPVFRNKLKNVTFLHYKDEKQHKI